VCCTSQYFVELSIKRFIAPVDGVKTPSFFKAVKFIVTISLETAKELISNTSWPSIVDKTALGGSSVKELLPPSEKTVFKVLVACESVVCFWYLKGRSEKVIKSTSFLLKINWVPDQFPFLRCKENKINSTQSFYLGLHIDHEFGPVLHKGVSSQFSGKLLFSSALLANTPIRRVLLADTLLLESNHLYKGSTSFNALDASVCALWMR